MKRRSLRNGFVGVALVGGWLLAGPRAHYAQDVPPAPADSAATETTQRDTIVTNAATAKPEGVKAEPNAVSAAEHSPGVDDVLRMVKAGVSMEVIKTYIENSPVAYNLSPTDIIALKNHAVPDDLTTAMVKRGTALRAQASPSSNASVIHPAYSGNRRHYSTFDPEGYDYFQYYYLYPRTLAAANQRLYSPYSPFTQFPSYGYYGLYGPRAFQPLPPSVFRRP